MATIALTVAYNGAAFAGFARQEGQRTVQGVLEQALETVARIPIETVGAGRTDAGVHATGQVVSCAVPAETAADDQRLMRSLNALTPSDIAVRAVQAKEDSFNARFDALSRTYLYRIAQSMSPPLFMAPYSWFVAQSLDVDAMRAAADHLIGEHDFASFCVARSVRDLHGRSLSTRREVLGVEIVRDVVMDEPILNIRVQGNAFLHSMVRVIVGTLVEVGHHFHDPDWVAEVIESRDRTRAGQTAPAHGLTLLEVTYPAT